MNRGLVFFLGFLTGIAAAVIGIMFLGYLLANNPGLYPVENTPEPVERVIKVEEDTILDVSKRQYVEVRGRKGEVSLYVGMPKDSVKTLVGKPTKVNMRTMGPFVFEDWVYIFPGQGAYGGHRHLTINFTDGALNSIQEL